MAKYRTHPQAKMLTLCTHTFESMNMHRHTLIYKGTHAGAVTYTHKDMFFSFFLLFLFFYVLFFHTEEDM